MNCTIACPSCQRTLRVPEELLGQSVKCPSCDHVFTAPESVEEEAPRRSAAPPEAVYEDEPPPSRRRPREELYEDDEDAPRRRRHKPGKVLAIAIMILVGGILATINGAIWLAYMGIFGVASFGFGFLCCLWPGPYYALTYGIMAIVKGSRLLGDKAHAERPPYGIANMMIINIINFDVPGLVMGILVLVFLNDPEVRDYFRSGGAARAERR
jgi:predicted Zn finger-like uncharacterized protein